MQMDFSGGNLLNGGVFGDSMDFFSPLNTKDVPSRRKKESSSEKRRESKSSSSRKEEKVRSEKKRSDDRHRSEKRSSSSSSSNKRRNDSDKKDNSEILSTEAVVQKQLRRLDRQIAIEAELPMHKDNKRALKKAKAKSKAKEQMSFLTNLVQFPSLCSSCGHCGDDDCGCSVPRVPVRDGASHCHKPLLPSSKFGYVFNVLNVSPPPAISFVTNWDSNGNLVITPAVGFTLDQMNADFGFNRTFSSTNRIVVRIADSVAIANMPTETLNQMYMVEDITSTGYVLRPTRFSHRNCDRPRVGDFWRIRNGNNMGIYNIAAMTDCTDYWTFTTTFNQSLNFYVLQHVACRLACDTGCESDSDDCC